VREIASRRVILRGLRIAAAGAVAVLPATLAVPAAAPAAPARPDAWRRTAVPAAFADQEISWARCLDPRLYPGLPRDFYRIQCGSFRAPADWADPDDGATVTVAISRLPATVQPARGVTFTNPGGPGEPGLELPLVLSQAGRTALLRTQDVYGIDVRGTGASTNATCGGPTLEPLLDPRDRGTENLNLIMDSADLVARFCAGARGLPIERVTTANTVRDLDLLRRLVGAPEINWIGYSAGTWLGAQYADTFPRTTGRFVYDSATDITGSWQQAFHLQPMGFERRLRRDFMRWAARFDDVFGLGRTAGDVLKSYERIRARLTPQTPVESALVLDRALAAAMYSSETFVDAALLLTDLEAFLDAQGGGDRVAAAQARARIAAQPLLTGTRRAGLPGMVPGARDLRGTGGRLPMASDATDATFLAITCNDTSWTGNRAQLVDRSSELGRKYPLIGPGTLNEPCAFWRVDSPNLVPPAGSRTPPALVVQSAHDPATPLEGARRTVAALPGSRMLLVTGEGDHGLYAGGNACVDRVVERWIVDGRMPAAGATCHGKGIPDPLGAGLPVRRQSAPPATAAAPGNPLLGLERLRAEVRGRFTCRTGAAAGC
jgi:pimeloyl-ACP methyl ester carboxylesterase